MSSSSQIDFPRYVAKVLQVAPASIAIPVPLASVITPASFVRIKAYRGLTRAANTGTVYITDKTTNDDTQGYPLAPGETVEIALPNDGIFDLSKIYVDSATVLDGVVVLYATPIYAI